MKELILSLFGVRVPFFNKNLLITVAKRKEDPMDDEETILRKMRRLTDNYDIHKEIGR